jgi:hypothetical protein
MDWENFDAHINSIIRIIIPVYPPGTTEEEEKLVYRALVKDSKKRTEELENRLVSEYERKLEDLDKRKTAHDELLRKLTEAKKAAEAAHLKVETARAAEEAKKAEAATQIALAEAATAVALTEEATAASATVAATSTNIGEEAATARAATARAATARAEAEAARATAAATKARAEASKASTAHARTQGQVRRLTVATTGAVAEVAIRQKTLQETEPLVGVAEAALREAEAGANQEEQKLSRFRMIVNFSKIHPCVKGIEPDIISKQSFPDSKQIVSDNFVPVEPKFEPTDKIKDSEKAIGEIFDAKTLIDHSTTYNPSRNINALIKLSPVSGSTEKLWLEKLINDMKINYMAMQTNILHDYKIKVLAKLPLHLQEKYKNMLKDPYKVPTSHIDILKGHVRNLFKDFDFDKSQTQNYMDRLNETH